MALNLLDSDFHDENIRAFAVEVLEVKLLDEDLEDYILQLIQVYIYTVYSWLNVQKDLLARSHMK